MAGFLDSVIQRAKMDKQTIVLPEGTDERTLIAARKIIEAGIANVIVLADPDKVGESGHDLEGVTVIDHRRSELRDEYAARLAELRKKKGLTVEDALRLLDDELYFGVMMVHEGAADGMVAGAAHATGDVLRPALQILKTAPGTKLVSAFFIMCVPDCEYGDDGVMLFGDCGLNENPDADELSEIAIASAGSFKALVGEEPRVAMLSYSTRGSAHNALVDKVVEATRLAQEKAPGLMLDGELQADAALVPSVGASKAPGSSVAGSANVLIFPDLQAGNIAYKLVERLAKADAFGPITQGIAKPVNDLSRGCSAEDIVGVAAITCVQSQNRKSQLA